MAVVRSLLASERGREIDRIRASGIARRTYQEIRRRAFAEGWLYDAYVPDGPHFGWPFATFSLVHPYLDRIDIDRRRWAEDPSVVILWSSPEALFRVSFNSVRPRPEGKYRRQFDLTVDARAPTVPVYFDYEGGWVRWTGQDGTLAYPQPLPGTGGRVDDKPSPRTLAKEALAARKLVGGAGPPPQDSEPRRGELALPRGLRRTVQAGHLRYRVFPRLNRLPPFEGNPIQRVAFLHGRLEPERRPDELFRAIVSEAGVYPFLFVTDGRTVLLGALSSERFQDDRRPVLESLRPHLAEIEVTRMDLRSLSAVVDHQYERLFMAPQSLAATATEKS
ncbi:MAG: hypothetical protein L3K01_05340 [Thermoplasmata archaeon]|nr:hypothetical protein [Thermoplasmata archaeon]